MSQPLSSASTIVVSPSQVSTDLDGEVMILGMKAARYYSLDAVGCRIWSIIQQPTVISDLCGRLQEVYEVAPERCQAEVLHLLSELAQEGLIETCSPAA